MAKTDLSPQKIMIVDLLSVSFSCVLSRQTYISRREKMLSLTQKPRKGLEEQITPAMTSIMHKSHQDMKQRKDRSVIIWRNARALDLFA